MALHSFAKDSRILRNSSFVRIYAAGKRTSDSSLVLVACLKAAGSQPRLGLSVSRKVGNAVVRNRLKRRLRELYRLNRAGLKPVDLVVVARAPSAKLHYAGLQACFLKLCRQADLMVS